MDRLISEGKIYLTFLLLAIFLFLLDNLHLFVLPKRFLLNLTTPIQYGLYQSTKKFSSQVNTLLSLRYAAKENAALKIQLANLLSENSKLRQIASFENSITQQTKYLNPDTFTLLPVKIINVGRFITLDKGSNDNLAVKMPVVYQDSLIGVIAEVEPSRSKVMLISDPESKISCFVNNSAGKANGLLVGQFQAELLLDKILHQEPVAVGDIVYTSGADALPKGLIVGTVSEIIQQDNEVFKSARVKPLFDPTELDNLFIITN